MELDATLGVATQRGRKDIAFTVSGYGLTYTNPSVTVSSASG